MDDRNCTDEAGAQNTKQIYYVYGRDVKVQCCLALAGPGSMMSMVEWWYGTGRILWATILELCTYAGIGM